MIPSTILRRCMKFLKYSICALFLFAQQYAFAALEFNNNNCLFPKSIQVLSNGASNNLLLTWGAVFGGGSYPTNISTSAIGYHSPCDVPASIYGGKTQFGSFTMKGHNFFQNGIGNHAGLLIRSSAQPNSNWKGAATIFHPEAASVNKGVLGEFFNYFSTSNPTKCQRSLFNGSSPVALGDCSYGASNNINGMILQDDVSYSVIIHATNNGFAYWVTGPTSPSNSTQTTVVAYIQHNGGFDGYGGMGTFMFCNSGSQICPANTSVTFSNISLSWSN